MSMLFNGLTGVQASQVALNTVSQNLANALTPNYTRQGVMLTAKAAANSALAAGDGVAVTSLIRYADTYKTQQMWRAASTQGQYEAAQTYLLQLEQVMGDADGGINMALDGFFSALSAASVEPTSTPLRQQIIESAKALGQTVNNISQIVANQALAVRQQRSVAVDQVNSYINEIAALNDKIAQSSGAGLNTSSLQDQRDAKIDQLSKLVGVQSTLQPDGSVNLSLKGGQPLVVGNRAATVQLDPGSQSLSVVFGTETFQLGADNWGGTLGGLAALERDVLAPMDASVRGLAGSLLRKSIRCYRPDTVLTVRPVPAVCV
jgi:flagellar hook-associated protein 1 FlgK